MKRPCGFRMTWADAVVLVVAGVATAAAYPWLGGLAWLSTVVAGHFFVFCNVFRIHRVLELLWAGAFVVNVSVWCILADIYWFGVLGVQSPITLAFIALAFVQPDYHGVGWRFAPRPRVSDPHSDHINGATTR